MTVLRSCVECGRATAETFRGRCVTCRRSTTERGYGVEHQRARAELAAQLPARCAYGCGTLLTADSDWVAAHVVDGDPSSPRVPSCRRCNERAKGRAGQISGRTRGLLTQPPLREKNRVVTIA